GTPDVKFYIDNWKIVPVPTCPKPTFLGVSDITFESAVLTWTSDGSLFDIEYGETGFTPTGNPSPGLAGISGTTYTLTGLEPETNYQFYVRQDCGDGDTSIWTGPITFTTLSDSITELPYIENFDTYGTGSNAFPDCWLRPVTYDNGTIWPSIVAVAGSSTPNSLRFQSLATDPTYAVS